MSILQDLTTLDRFRNLSPLLMYKEAAEEGNEGNYEKALSNIAHAYVNDIAPELLPYELGFQLIEKASDNNRAVGIFGFKKNNLLLYIPVFYIDGEIKGLDLLYVYNLGVFVPNTQDMIRRLLNSSDKFGVPVDAFKISNNVAYPNLYQLKPTALKWASEQPVWLRPVLPFFIFQKNRPSIEYRSRTLNLLEKSASARTRLANFLYQFPDWAATFYELYGDRLTQILKKGSLLYDPAAPKNPDPPHVPTLDQSEEPADVAIFREINKEARHRLTDAELKILREQGYYVKDKRSKTTVIRPKITSIRTSGSVSVPGFYHLLLQNGNVVCALVVPLISELKFDTYVSDHKFLRKNLHPDSVKFRKVFVIPLYVSEIDKKNILRKFSGKYGFVVHSRKLSAVPFPKDDEKHKITDLESVNDELEGLDNGKNKSTDRRIVVYTDKEAFGPVTIYGKDTKYVKGKRCLYGIGSSERVVIVEDPAVDDIVVHSGESPHYTAFYHDSIPAYSYSQIGDNASTTTIVRVPRHAQYAITVEGDDTSENEISHIQSGLLDVDSLPNFAAKLADGELKIIKIGSDEYTVNNTPYLGIDALITLIKDYGLKEIDAKRVLKEADIKGETAYLYKFAQVPGYPPQMLTPPTVSLPQVSPDAAGMIANYPAISPTASVSTIDNAGQPPPDMNAPVASPMTELDKSLRQAISTGQKEIFDTAIFADLIHAVDDADMINKYVPDLYRGLNAIGKILFNMYMHYQAFTDRFGRDGIKELEASIRSTFKNLGATILALEKKQPNYRFWETFPSIA